MYGVVHLPLMNIILVGYTPERTRKAIAFCELTFGKLPLRHRILVLNLPEAPVPEEANGWEIIRGSNVLGEFSGWQEGLARLSDLGEQEAVVFVNDTVGAYQHMSVFRRWCLAREIRSMSANRMVGFTQDSTGLHGALTVRGLPAYPFVPSFCFALPYQVLVKLERRLWNRAEVESCVHGGVDRDRFFTEEVSPALQEHLKWWLFEGWHRSEPLDSGSERRLRFKAHCIFAEFLLSAHCRRLGVELRDPLKHHRVARALEALNGVRYEMVQRLKFRPDHHGSAT
jgi:hypothetical protein